MSHIARICFGVIAVMILVPPNAFPGADLLDWIGLGGAVVALTIEFIRSRSARLGAAPQKM